MLRFALLLWFLSLRIYAQELAVIQTEYDVERDTDGDGIRDIKDDCIYQIGTAEFGGCQSVVYTDMRDFPSDILYQGKEEWERFTFSNLSFVSITNSY